jgi:hypothetical protein
LTSVRAAILRTAFLADGVLAMSKPFLTGPAGTRLPGDARTETTEPANRRFGAQPRGHQIRWDQGAGR